MSLPAKVANTLLLSVAVIYPTAVSAAPVTFNNASQLTTMNGELVHAHGGGVIKSNGYYYLAGEQRGPDGWLFGAVSLYRSADMVHWTHVNDILTPNSSPELAPSNIERPKIIYNAAYNHYVLWAHKENGEDYGDAEVAVAVSPTVDGDYVYQGSFRPLGYDSRDQTVFVDKDGTGYLVSASNVNLDLHIYRLTADYLGVAELVYVFKGNHREAPAVFERNGVYFMVTSGASGWNANQQKYATTTQFPAGNWSGWKNVGSSNGFGSQTTYVTTISGTQGSSYLYMGDRWGPQWDGNPNDSLYVWLPLKFPTNNTLAMDWYPQLTIDTDTGKAEGIAHDTTTLISRNSGKCADVVNQSWQDGADIIQWTCNGGTNQEWAIQPTGDGYHRLIAWHSGKCLTVEGNESGTQAQQQACTDDGAGQTWQLRDTGDGYVEIVSRDSGKCLDVNGQSTENSARLQQWGCWGGSNQQWRLSAR
ncbi:RICIN domain-containing protein [Gynuella sp.]|uniref:RICIN domain-containing protein n=1 Tax=Gynuella sp. TaxID=2969146 RepID=UPI003D145352